MQREFLRLNLIRFSCPAFSRNEHKERSDGACVLGVYVLGEKYWTVRRERVFELKLLFINGVHKTVSRTAVIDGKRNTVRNREYTDKQSRSPERRFDGVARGENLHGQRNGRSAN